MTPKFYQSEGIVLQATPFKEKDKILTLFTKEGGIIKLFVKGKLSFQNALTERFTIGDYLFKAGKGDLFQFCDGSLLEQNLGLRSSWDRLQLGEKLSSALLKSQWPEKSSPALYFLFVTFLKKIGITEDLRKLETIFYLKLLKHEGILQLTPHCSQCEKEGNFRFGGECFCSQHAPQESQEMESGEEENLRTLFDSTSFDTLLSAPLSEKLSEKIEKLFTQVYR